MKILHVLASLNTGGGEKLTIELCNELSIKDEVVLCVLFMPDTTTIFDRMIDKKVRVVYLNKKKGFDPKILLSIAFLLWREKPDIIHTHLRALLYVALPSIVLQKKVFHTMHNIAEKEIEKPLQMFNWMLFRLGSIYPVAISPSVLLSVQRLYGRRHTYLVENGVKRIQQTKHYIDVENEVASYKTTENTQVLLNIGRISYQKNQRMLIDVFNELLGKGYDICLLIIGHDETEGEGLLKDLRRLVKDQIHFLGLKRNIADYLKCSNAFCLSSEYEGLPITLLEAMSLGIIPVCTPVGGIPDVIESGVNGILSIDKDCDSYCAALEYFLKMSEANRLLISKNAIRCYSEKYCIEIMTSRYRSLYSATR